MKNIEIQLPDGGIVITPKEGKTAKQTTTEKGIIITFEDIPKEKTFEEYVKGYIDNPLLFPRNYFLTGDIEYLKHNMDVRIWPYELKMGLLKFIADELNKENPGDQTDQLKLIDNRICAIEPQYQNPSPCFTQIAAEKACKIIPVEFFESIHK